MADLMHILVIVSIGDHRDDIDRLVTALEKIALQSQGSVNYTRVSDGFQKPYSLNTALMPPRKAFFSNQTMLPLEEALGKISADIVTVYPPGIPLLIPGEQITRDILDFLFTMKETGATLDGLDPSNSMMKVVEPS